MGCALSNDSPDVTTPQPGEAENKNENLEKTNEEDFANKPCDSTMDDTKCIVGSDFVPPAGGRLNQVPVGGGAPVDLNQLKNIENLESTEIVLKSGGVYIGEWDLRTLKKNGKGVLKLPDGTQYSGQFKQNTAAGEGEWKGPDGSSYSGQWKSGRLEGNGHFIHPDGSTYDGQWVADIKQGKGKEIWADGTIFEGNFVEGNKKGEGKITFANRGEYVGQFNDDFFNGKGKYVWPNGHVYEGDWKNGLMHGKGIYSWSGEGQFIKYEGQYIEGKKCGKGKLFFKDQRIYDGLFQDNKQHGIGFEIWPRGDQRKGEWKDGKLYQWLDEQKQVFIPLPDDFEQHKDYSTSAYSNPQQYHLLHQTVDTYEKRVGKLKQGPLMKKGLRPQTHDIKIDQKKS